MCGHWSMIGGEALGCGAHVIKLRRLVVGPYLPDRMVSMETIEEKCELEAQELRERYVLPVSSSVVDLPEVRLSSPSMVFYLQQGQPIFVPGTSACHQVRLHDPSGHFLGVGEVMDDGKIAPRRLVKKS